MGFYDIMLVIIETLKREVPSLRTVEPHEGQLDGDIERMPLNLPAAYVVHGESKYEAFVHGTMEEKAQFRVLLVTKQGNSGGPVSPEAGAHSLIDEVHAALSVNSPGLDTQKLRPTGVSIVLKKNDLMVHALDFNIGLDGPVVPGYSSATAIKTAHMNILESSAVSLISGSEDPAYPLYKLYDRNISRPFRAAAVEKLGILIDQGGTSPPNPVDTLIIPEGHNLQGASLGIKYSDDGVTYSDALAEWNASGSLIYKAWAPVASRYWKFVINSPLYAPSIQEIFLTSMYKWERMPLLASGPMEDLHNVVMQSTSDGRQRFMKTGPYRRRRVYELSRCPTSMRDEMVSLWKTWGDGKTFWLSDHEGHWIYGGLEGGLELGQTASDSYTFSFKFLELLS